MACDSRTLTSSAVFDQGVGWAVCHSPMEYVPGRTLRNLLHDQGWLSWREALECHRPDPGPGWQPRSRPGSCTGTSSRRISCSPRGMGGSRSRTSAWPRAQCDRPKQSVWPGTVGLDRLHCAGTGHRRRHRRPYRRLRRRRDAVRDAHGWPPHAAESPLAIAYKHVNEDVPAPSGWVTNIPRTVDQLVRTATSRDPQRRPSDAEVFLRACAGHTRGRRYIARYDLYLRLRATKMFSQLLRTYSLLRAADKVFLLFTGLCEAEQGEEQVVVVFGVADGGGDAVEAGRRIAR